MSKPDNPANGNDVAQPEGEPAQLQRFVSQIFARARGVTNRRRILRPKPGRWDIMFCCNDYRHGMATGKVETIKFGIGRGNFEFGTDWCDDFYLTIQGPAITFRWIDANYFKLSRWKHRCFGSRQWVGNWCWDACFVATHTVREVATMLRKRRWSPEEGSEILWNWWDKLLSV